MLLSENVYEILILEKEERGHTDLSETARNIIGEWAMEKRRKLSAP